MILAAALLLQVQPAAAHFAPPLSAPLHVVVERTDGGAAARRFTLERLIRFARDGTGYRAEVLVLASEGSGPPALGAMVEAGFAALRGTPVVFHLDAAGEVTAIDDMARVWERLCGGIAEVASRRPGLSSAERQALAGRVAAPLRGLPPERQRALLGSLVSGVIAAEVPGASTAVPVRLPGVSPFGQPIVLAGTRETAAHGDSLIHTTRAAADVALPAQGAAPARSGRVELELVRTSRRDTGLIASSTETVRSRATSGEDVRETVRTTRISVRTAAPGAWPDPG